MKFPDRLHFEKLSQSLWERFPDGRAAVMIGSGMSINADPLPGKSGHFPTWSALASALTSRLHPEGPTCSQFPKSFLKIASEFEVEFGRTELEKLISETIPDQEFIPSRIHLRLLELPWVDVFTTNYDTLLERTPVQNRAYHLVTKPTDLARDRGPRIIKLHGSFPSQSPFIVTEEDFRTYPRINAPFVNTVQQSLLENTFLLLGFSGEDPNFLAWTGWIRDQLADQHSQIYLCGVLTLTSAEKRLCEKRGIRLIDLAPIVSSLDDPEKKHRTALEWVIEQLHLGEPKSPEDWPDIVEKQQLRLPQLPPPLRPTNLAKECELKFPLSNENLTQFISRWSEERKAYPNWIIAPGQVRETLWEKTFKTISAIQSFTSSWSLGSRLHIAHEINWRISTSLGVYCVTWLDHTTELLESILKEPQAFEDLETPEFERLQLTKQDYRQIISGLILAVMRDSRQCFDFQKWEHWRSKLTAFHSLNSISSPDIDYEDTLCALWKGKRHAARNLITKFSEPRGPLDLIKKASLLAELDDVGTAKRISETALLQIREALRQNGDSIELLSLEGWCLYLMLHYTVTPTLSEKDLQRSEYRKRWRMLRNYHCDPWPIKDEMEERLKGDIPNESGGRFTTHDFFPFRLNITQTWKSDTITQFLPAYSYLNLFETVGIPLRTTFYTITNQAFISAVRWIDFTTPNWIPAILIRRGSITAFKEHDLLTRCDVSLLESATVSTIYLICIEAFDDGINSASHARDFSTGDVDTIAVAVEILSRIAFRLSEEQLKDSFDRSLKLRQIPGVASHRILHSLCEPWFERILYGAPQSLTADWLEKILLIPPFDTESESDIPRQVRCADPIIYFDINATKDALSTTHQNERWESLLEQQFRSAEFGVGELRDRYISRLIRLHIWGILGKKDDARLGKLLWADASAESKLPRNHGFSVSSYLKLPSPATIIPSKELRTKLLGKAFLDLIQSICPTNEAEVTRSVGMRMNEIVHATAFPTAHDASKEFRLRWTKSESQIMTSIAFSWWPKIRKLLQEKSASTLAPMDIFFVRSSLVDHIKEFRCFLSDVCIPFASRKHVGDLVKILSDTDEFAQPLLEMKISTLSRIPDAANNVIEAIRLRIQSDDREGFNDAVLAISRWRELSLQSNTFPKLPVEFVSAVVSHVSFRKKPFVANSFSLIKLLIRGRSELLSGGELEMLVRSMDAWEFSTRIELNRKLTPFEQAENLDLRAHIAGLVSTILSENYVSDTSVLSTVRDRFERDEAPEIKVALKSGRSGSSRTVTAGA